MVELTRMSIARPFVHLLLMGLVVVAGCPSDCICKWKGGKQNVECVNRSLRTFPPTIDPGTQVLDVSGNSFETLPPDHFMRSGLINLQKIYLSRCRLSHINSRAFRGLSNLVDLDLGHNLLREVPTASFPDCPGLMRLILSGNPIPHIPKRAFVSLQSLTTLELSHSGIEVIEHGAFEGLHSLEWLKLSGNRLRRVGGLGALPLGLKGVWLEDNPWQCDCGLVELRLWLGERNVANSVEPRCQGPDRLTNLTIRELPADNFACTPQLSPTTMFQKIGEGKNVSLLCKVSSVPESSLEWLFNGQPLSNSSLNLLVETSGAYPVGSPLSSQPLLPPSSSLNSPSSSSLSLASIPVEKKSELLILNATSDENGTFLCVARNPAGTAMANFTVRVLTKYDTDTPTDYLGPIPLFVSSYPNLFIIVLSTIAVIGFVIVVSALSLLVCKCSRLCSKNRRGEGGRRSSSRSSIGSGSGGGGGGDGRLSNGKGKKGKGLYGNGGSGGNHGDSKDLCSGGVVSICGGGARDKLDRHLSETSTLTTHTKSNGSVFLLSTSSELGLGDSNPDLIEGVKRVEGDGHETSFNNFGSSIYCSSSNIIGSNSDVPQSYGGGGGMPTKSHSGTLSRSGHQPSSAVILEPSQFNPYPMDYGLPTKGVHVATSTLIRRSPSYPVSSGGPTSTSGSGNTPPYDLAKYPKEYISPQSHHPSSYGYGHPQSQSPLPSHPQLMYSPGGPADFYPTYILPPGTYVTTYSGPGGEEYAAIATMGGYTHQLLPDPSGTSSSSVPQPSSPMVPCSCAPILEANESLENDQPVTTTNSTTTTATSPILNCSSSGKKNLHESQSLNKDGSGPSKVEGKTGGTGGGGGGSGGSGGSNIARLQRQLTTQINESPDEGYEDEGAEGTEI